MPEPAELKEYEYRVGHLPVTAMLTEKQAERLGAVAPGTSQDKPVGQVDNNEAERVSTDTRKSEDDGVTEGTVTTDRIEKARQARNKRATG